MHAELWFKMTVLSLILKSFMRQLDSEKIRFFDWLTLSNWVCCAVQSTIKQKYNSTYQVLSQSSMIEKYENIEGETELESEYQFATFL